MTQTKDRRIPLHALSDGQRRTLEGHLPLVQHTLSRSLHRRHHRRQLADYEDLLQEGCLALVEAFLHHNPVRHGRFAAYAMARVHYAVGRYLHENASFLRVPYISRRRQQTPRAASVIPREALIDRPAPCRPAGRRLTDVVENDPCPTIADLIHRRYQIAAIQAARKLKRRLGRKSKVARLIDLCYRTRWTVPDANARDSLRRIADEIGCSVGRVVYTESAFLRLVRRRLVADKSLKSVMASARRSPEGWEEPLKDQDIRPRDFNSA